MLLLSGLFALLATGDAFQLVQAARGSHPDPPGLLVTHGVTGVLAAGVAWGVAWRRSWATWAVLAWGAVTAAMLIVMGPVLDEPPEQWRALRIAAALVMAFTFTTTLYLRRRISSENSLDRPR